MLPVNVSNALEEIPPPRAPSPVVEFSLIALSVIVNSGIGPPRKVEAVKKIPPPEAPGPDVEFRLTELFVKLSVPLST